jgi:AcrR family transcriptional regulator
VSRVGQKQEKRRVEIIEKTLKLMETVPFDDISIQDICSFANISIGSFYHYFSRKSDLLVGLLGLIDVYMGEQVFPLLTNEDELENLKLLFRGFCQRTVETGLERAKLVSACHVLDQDLYGEMRPLWKKVAEIVGRGQEKGQITTLFPTDKLSDLLLISMRGFVFDWSRRDGSYSLIERMDEFVKLFFPALVNTATRGQADS